MRIAVWHNLPSGGGKRALYDHVAGLVARGHTVESWCPPTADRDYLPLSAIVPEHVVDLSWPVPYTTLDKLGITTHAKRETVAMDAHCRICAEEIDRGDFDILFANSCAKLRSTAIGRYAKTPSVIYLGEPNRFLYEALPRLPWLAPPRREQRLLRPSNLKAAVKDARLIRDWRWLAREEVDNAGAFDRILVNSYFSRESILRAYGLESNVCYLGIDTKLFVDRQAERKNMIVGLGSFTVAKNIRLCIESLARVPPPRPALVWVANIAVQVYLEEMRALAKSLNVEFHPKVNIADAELVSILGQAKAMLYAPRLEPFGLAPLEANACGVPVVAVAEGGVRETMIDGVTGFLVDSNADSMAGAVSKLISDPLLAREMGRNARLNVEKKWSMDAAIDRLEGFLINHSRKHSNERLSRRLSGSGGET